MSTCLFFFPLQGGTHSVMQVARLGGQIRAGAASYSYSSRQCQIPNPLSEARGQTHILTDTGWICFCCPRTGPPSTCLFETQFSPQERQPNNDGFQQLLKYSRKSSCCLFSKRVPPTRYRVTFHGPLGSSHLIGFDLAVDCSSSTTRSLKFYTRGNSL